MNIRDYLASSIIVTLFFINSTTGHAKNCIKGKPCGNGCIALTKSCRINNSGVINSSGTSNRSGNTASSHRQSVLRTSQLRLPKVYIVSAGSIDAKDAPHSKKITAHYKQGRRVFVYETFQSWARINNMKPEEWIELIYLKQK